MTFQLLPAAVDDAPLLSAIALVAKQGVGYPDGWMASWSEELTVTADYVRHHWIRKAVDEFGRSHGFIGMQRAADGAADVDYLFILPASQRLGLGRQLLAAALDAAREQGCRTVRLSAEPSAESFYRRLGASVQSIIPVPMPGAPERVLPRMAWQLQDTAQGNLK
jgi:GNAT superfamily N-acetyltransferase